MHFSALLSGKKLLKYQLADPPAIHVCDIYGFYFYFLSADLVASRTAFQILVTVKLRMCDVY